MRKGRDARRRRARLAGRQATWLRVTAAASSAALLGTLGLAGTSMAATAHSAKTTKTATRADTTSTSSCHLGNGVKHVVELTFDNVHYFRDNPNVPSDLEMLPNLLNFFEDNGTFLANNHTPLIAHTADDILTTYTGLYGDRQGMPVSNDYQVYNKNGPNGSFDTTDSARLVRVLDRCGQRHDQPAEPRPRHQPEHGLLAGAAGHRGAPGDAGHDHPGALGAVHPGRL